MKGHQARPAHGAPVAAGRLDLGLLRDRLGDAPNGLAFLEAWDRWRGDKLVPTRDDLRPERLGPCLRAITVMCIEAPERIVIRLAAATYERLVGQSAKGKNYVEMAAPRDRPTRIARHQNIVNRPCGALARSRVLPPSGLAVLARNLLLPVAAGPEGPINYVYNCADIERHRVVEPEPEASDPAPLAAEFSYVDIGAGLPR